MKLAPLRNWQNHPTAGTHLGIVETSASPVWVDHTSDRPIKGSGRSCMPQGNGTGRHPLFVFNWSWLVADSLDADQVSLSFHRHLLQDRCQPPSAVLGPFQVRFWGGGVHLSQIPRIMHKGQIIYAKRNPQGCGRVGVGADGSAHHPPW
jgi:hypothetical protein